MERFGTNLCNGIFLLIISFCFFHRVSSMIVVAPHDETVLEGMSVTLRCTIHKNGTEAIHWRNLNTFNLLSSNERIFPGGLVSQDQQQRLSITGNHDNGDYNLYFRNVSFVDAGRYSCGYFSIASTQAVFSPVARIKVIRNPQCSKVPSRMTMPGDQVQLICRSQNLNNGNPQVTWISNGKIIPGVVNSVPFVSNTINVHLDENDYNRVFICGETLSPLRYNPACTIIPLRKQSFVYFKEPSVYLQEGQTKSFRCLTRRTNPNILYAWYKNNVQLSLTQAEIDIGPVSTQDNGTKVTCSANANGTILGNDTFIFYVTSYSLSTENTVTDDFKDKTSFFIDGNEVRNASSDITKAMDSLHLLKTSISDVKYAQSPMQQFLMPFVVAAVIIGLLLINLIGCLAIFLIKGRTSVKPSDKNSVSETRTGNETRVDMPDQKESTHPTTETIERENQINEKTECNISPPTYFTLEPSESSRFERDFISEEGCEVTIITPPPSPTLSSQNSTKNYYHTDKESNNNPYDSPNINNIQYTKNNLSKLSYKNGMVSAYAVSNVLTSSPPSNHRPSSSSSVKRPLPARPTEAEFQSDLPTRSFSESRVHSKHRRNKDGRFPWSKNTNEITEASGEIDATQKSNNKLVSVRGKCNLTIDTDYTEIGGHSQDVSYADLDTSKTIVNRNAEKEYAFSSVYDSLDKESEESLEKVTQNSYMQYQIPSNAKKSKLLSKVKRSRSLEPNHTVAIKSDDLYASIEDFQTETQTDVLNLKRMEKTNRKSSPDLHFQYVRKKSLPIYAKVKKDRSSVA